MQNWYNDVSGHDVRVFAAFRFALAFFHVFHTACCCGLVHENGTNAILQVINTITQVQRMRSLWCFGFRTISLVWHRLTLNRFKWISKHCKGAATKVETISTLSHNFESGKILRKCTPNTYNFSSFSDCFSYTGCAQLSVCNATNQITAYTPGILSASMNWA